MKNRVNVSPCKSNGSENEYRFLAQKSQSQFPKRRNEPKSFYINDLRTTNHELSWEKQTQTNPISNPIKPNFKRALAWLKMDLAMPVLLMEYIDKNQDWASSSFRLEFSISCDSTNFLCLRLLSSCSPVCVVIFLRLSFLKKCRISQMITTPVKNLISLTKNTITALLKIL